MRHKLDPVQWRAAWWTWREMRRVQRELSAKRWLDVVVEPPRHLPPGADKGVMAVLRRYPETCLSQALIRQAYFAAHGEARDVVVGVCPPASGFKAHAWLDGDPAFNSDGYQELARRPAIG